MPGDSERARYVVQYLGHVLAEATHGSATARASTGCRDAPLRRVVILADGPAWTTQRVRLDSTFIKELARAFRWKRMLDAGRYGSVGELAAAEKLDRGYLGRILMLTLLAPDIVQAIMDGRRSGDRKRSGGDKRIGT
jgi:hypothetical protein